MKNIFNIKNIVIVFVLILFDLAVYVFLGLMLMTYDDFYDESEGEYWSLESMTFWEKVNYLGLNAWHVINLIVLAYIIYRIIKSIRKRT